MPNPYDEGFEVGYNSKLPLQECLALNPYLNEKIKCAEWANGCRAGFISWFAE